MHTTFAPAHIVGDPTKTFPLPRAGSKVTVVGAGAFGGWTSLFLQRSGFKVTLIDAWGPGNARSSSGDDTRVIRSTYGGNEFYFDLNVRSLQLWKENQKHFGRQLFFNSGVIWFCYSESTPLVDLSIPFAKKHSMEYQYLSREEIQQKYPFVHSKDLHHAYLDPFGGYLKARESCLAVIEAFCKEGGTYLQQSVLPGEIQSGRLNSIRLSNGSEWKSDSYLFACGSWLGRIFPDVLGKTITCTRQEVYYFGPPAGRSAKFDEAPVWVDVDGRDFYYGIPGNSHRGFKIGVDIRGPLFDPTEEDHHPDPTVLAHARKFISHRFPALANAPLLESRVCPYESTVDGNFIFDKHPQAENVWFLGGGSGHGFKHGPGLGELVADVWTGKRKMPGMFTLSNQDQTP